MDEELTPEVQDVSALIRALEAANSKDVLGQTFVDSRGRRFIVPVVFAYGLDSTGGIQELIDSSGRVPVDVKTSVNVVSSSVESFDKPTDNSNAGVTVTTGEIWEVHEYFFSCLCDASVASRTFQGQVALGGRQTALAATETIATTSLTLTASEPGDIKVTPDNGRVLTHDANVQAIVTDDAPLPRYLFGGDTVTAAITANKQTGDRVAVSVLRRRIA